MDCCRAVTVHRELHRWEVFLVVCSICFIWKYPGNISIVAWEAPGHQLLVTAQLQTGTQGLKITKGAFDD